MTASPAAIQRTLHFSALNASGYSPDRPRTFIFFLTPVDLTAAGELGRYPLAPAHSFPELGRTPIPIGMATVRALVVALALLEAGWMTFDGSRALAIGDYVTPRTGPHAGQLGPWHHVVSAVGIAPRSTLMKIVFVAYGVTWLLLIVAFMRRMPWASTAMLCAAVGALWYLPIGTVCSILQIAGLLWLRRIA